MNFDIEYARGIALNHRPPSDIRIPSHRDAALQPEVPAARPHREGELPAQLAPALGDIVPDAEVITRECDRHRLALARTEEDVREAAQDARWLACAGGEVQVQLRNLYLPRWSMSPTLHIKENWEKMPLAALDLASVLHRERHPNRGTVQPERSRPSLNVRARLARCPCRFQVRSF